jgi:uncharacterized protein (DUF1330 family)
MKTRVAVALSLIAGFGLGAVTIEGLHAQTKAKAPVYLVAEIDVSNPEAYAKEFVPIAQASVKQYGGRFLAASSNVTTLEGAPAKRVAVQVWDSMEQAKAWRNSPEYTSARKIGDKYAKFRALLVEGVPQP